MMIANLTSPVSSRRVYYEVDIHWCYFFFQAEDGIRDWSVTGVQTCALFFQAEDGIRDWSVTGVQTCALPICTEMTVVAAMVLQRLRLSVPEGASAPRPVLQVTLRPSTQIGRASCRERV